MAPIFFANPPEFSAWMETHHEKETELLVGFYKVGSGKANMSWSDSVDVALCFGWIDGVRTSIDKDSYQIRFTPRKPSSIWSPVNIKKVETLQQQGLMRPMGIAAFEKCTVEKSKVYAFRNEEVKLSPEYEERFRANKQAWDYFQSLTPSYRKPSTNWVMSAKQEETRLKRLNELIEDSQSGTNKWKDNKYRKNKNSTMKNSIIYLVFASWLLSNCTSTGDNSKPSNTMKGSISTTTNPAETPGLRIVRKFNALPETVFDAFTKPEAMRVWWTDETVFDIDLRVGGQYKITRTEGKDVFVMLGKYLEIEKPKRLKYSIAMPQFSPNADTISIEIAPDGDKACILTYVQQGVDIASELRELPAGSISETEKGWRQGFDLMEAAWSKK